MQTSSLGFLFRTAPGRSYALTRNRPNARERKNGPASRYGVGTFDPGSRIRSLQQASNGQASAGYGKALFRSQMNPNGASIAQPNYLVKFTEVNLLEEKAKAGLGAQ